MLGDPDLVGITGVDGSGSLAADVSGSAEWLMIPYSIAAPEDDTLYDVGGRLSYTVGGSEFSVPLLPDTITVKPNPSLVVHYFHEKYIQGDDALTPEVEPIVPFSLAVLVMNNGYGVARNMKITSAQPEIIENEQGLLVTFNIVGAQLGNQRITPSLAVDFGDISSFETKTARWLLTSSLMGTFYNFSATFENINPLGDPQLSLLDELGYHELIHLVRIDHTMTSDDGLDDFLVNDRIDGNGLPDKLYNSANGSDVYDVVSASLLHIERTDTDQSGVVSVTLRVRAVTNQWFYLRLENNVTSSDPQDDEHLNAVVHESGRPLKVEKNVWQTTHIHDAFLIHLLDFIHDNTSDVTEIETSYTLLYGPHNTTTSMSSTTPGTGMTSQTTLDESSQTSQFTTTTRANSTTTMPASMRTSDVGSPIHSTTTEPMGTSAISSIDSMNTTDVLSTAVSSTIMTSSDPELSTASERVNTVTFATLAKVFVLVTVVIFATEQ